MTTRIDLDGIYREEPEWPGIVIPALLVLAVPDEGMREKHANALFREQACLLVAEGESIIRSIQNVSTKVSGTRMMDVMIDMNRHVDKLIHIIRAIRVRLEQFPPIL